MAQLVAGVLTEPGTRTPAHWTPALVTLAGLWALRALAQWAQNRLSQHGATAAIAELGSQVLTSVTAAPPRRQRTDEAAILVTHGLDGLRPYFTRFLPAAVQSALLTPAAIVVIGCYDIRSALIVLIALPLIPLFMVLIGLLTADRSAVALTAMDTLQSRLLDLIAGIPTLTALGRAEGAAPRIAELSAVHRRSTMATLRITFLSAFVLELLATLGVALVAVSVGLRLVTGSVTLAAALTALLLAPEVFWPLRRVGTEFHAAQDGKVAFGRAYALIESLDPPRRGGRRPDGFVIELQDISIHDRDGAAPDRLSLRAEPASVTVLTGPNGTGKSTALQAIAGLTDVDTGRVRIGGVDIAELDLEQWWTHIGWLPQRPVLIPGTVRDNLNLFGTLPDVESACRTSGFDGVLATLPDGLDTELGRDGAGLSLGQRQRLGLARTLGRPCDVLLLDEPTSHLDATMEDRVLQSIRDRAQAGATVLVVGHRDAVLSIGDRVVRTGDVDAHT